jgi:hypothetical protein
LVVNGCPVPAGPVVEQIIHTSFYTSHPVRRVAGGLLCEG